MDTSFGDRTGYGTTQDLINKIIKELETILDPIIGKLVEENKRMRDALQRIASWQEACPTSIFPEPDFEKVDKVFQRDGISLDAISASNMRFVLNGIKEIVDTGLGG